LDHYCERLGVAFLVDSPKVFRLFWNVAKTFVDEKTVNKVHFLSSSSQKKKVFPEYFDMKELEKDFGGTNPYKYDHATYFAEMMRLENKIRKKDAKRYGVEYKPVTSEEVKEKGGSVSLSNTGWSSNNKEDEELQKKMDEEADEMGDLGDEVEEQEGEEAENNKGEEEGGEKRVNLMAVFTADPVKDKKKKK